MIMRGMNALTGKAIEGSDHLHQSIRDIVETRVGSRVMSREYGTNQHDVIDAPMNGVVRNQLFAEIAIALDKWEPRFKLTRVVVDSVTDQGKVVLTLEGQNLVSGQEVRIEGIVL